MNLENPKELVKEIKKSGFPLEIDVFNKLISAGFSAGSSIYIDEDSGKSRELDIESSISYGTRDKSSFLMHFIIQCKSLSNKNWVFFDNTQKQELSPETELFHSCNHRHPEFSNFLKFLEEDKQKFNEAYRNIQGKGKIHKSRIEIPKNERKIDLLYESIITTIKAKRYFKNLYSEAPYGGEVLLKMFLPVIITDKISLWSVPLNGKKAELMTFQDLKKEKFILLDSNFLARDGEWESNTIFIVSIDYLEEFIKKVKDLSNFLYKKWSCFREIEK